MRFQAASTTFIVADAVFNSRGRRTLDDWTRLIEIADLPAGSRRFIAVGDHELAVFHLDHPDRFVVIDNACPHAAANLSAGELEDGRILTCPWHNWSFDLDTGACTMNEAVRVHRYTCKVEDGTLFAKLTPDTTTRYDIAL